MTARSSIRVRTTGAAVLAVSAALVVVAIGTLLFIDRSQREQVEDAAETRAVEIARSRAIHPSPAIAGSDAEDEFVQVLDADGDTVASSPNADELPPFDVAPGGTTDLSFPTRDGDRVPFLAVAVAAGEETVVVARSLVDAGVAVRQVVIAFAVAIPLLLVVVGLVTWRIVGRALAPVDAIREEVDAISVDELDRRVPAPETDDEIARLAATMNRMLERLQEGRARERRFVSDASHELRSPVAAIRQHAEVALRHPEGTDLATLAGVAHEESLRLQRIVEDLLLLSRIDEGTLRLRREPVDLGDLVQDEAARLRAATGATIRADRVAEIRIDADRERLERLVRNLGENAARHARSTVAIDLRRDDGMAVLGVEDDGAGIPLSERERVFDRFVRLDEARERDTGGSGLGLSIVREIATLHGGTARVVDGRLGGARLEVHLPA